MSGTFKALKDMPLNYPGATVKEYNHIGPHCGWRITLPNQYVVSVIYGWGTHSTHLWANPEDIPEGGWVETAETAEVAVFAPDRSWVLFEDGSEIEGGYEYSDVISLIDAISKLGEFS